MSNPIEYDIRADGRVWLDDEPVDATQYPVLDHIIRALVGAGLERFTNFPYPDHDILYGPGGSWVVWSGDHVACRVDERKATLADMHYYKDLFRPFVQPLNEGARDRTGAALGPLSVVLDPRRGAVRLLRGRVYPVARFTDEGPDDRPLSRYLEAWGVRLQAAVRRADTAILLGEESLSDPLPALQDAILSSHGPRQGADEARELAGIVSELPTLLEVLR